MNTGQFRIEGGHTYGEGDISEAALFGTKVATLSNFGNIKAKLFNTIYNNKWGRIPKLMDFFCQDSKMANMATAEANGRRYVWGVQPRYGVEVSLATALVGTNIGRGRIPFTICLDYGYHRMNDLIEFPSGVQAKMMNDGIAVGGHYEYQVIIEDLNVDLCLLATDQLMGTKVRDRGNIQGEGSYIGGHNKFVTPIYYDQYMTTKREHLKITRNAMTTPTWLIDDEASRKAGFKVGTWVDSAVWQWMNDKARDMVFQMVFGRRNVDAYGNCVAKDPVTGAPQYAGSGLYQQITAGNEFTYTGSFDLEFIKDVIRRLSMRSINTFGNQWLIMGGTAAAYMFHEAIKQYAGGQQLFIDGATFIGKDGMQFTYSEGYTTYRLLDNEFKFVHTDLFDDPYYWNSGANGMTNKSGELMIMNISELKGMGQPNLCKLKNVAGIGGAGEEGIDITLNGMIGFGTGAKGMSSSSFDGSERHSIHEFGYVLHTVESCGIIRPKSTLPVGF